MKSLQISYKLIYTLVFISFKISLTSAHGGFNLERFSFDLSEYKLVKSSSDEIFLIGIKDFIDVSNNKIIPYKNSLDSLFIDINFKDLNYVNLNDKIYLINAGGGYVLEFDYQSLKRIDNSDNLRAYYSSRTFSYKGDLYQFGGYGFFKFNSQLLKYNFKTRDWFLVDVILDQDFGFVDPEVLVYQNKLLIYSKQVFNNFFGKHLTNPYIYVYNFDSKEIDKIRFDNQKFDFLFGNNVFSSFNRFSLNGSFYIINYSNPNKIYSFDIINNNYKIITLSSPINSISNIEILGNDLYYLTSTENSNKIHLAKNIILKNTSMGSIKGNYHLFYSIVVVLLFFLSLYLFNRKKIFILEGKKLKKGSKKVKLDYDQIYFLNKLCKEKSVKNSDLISYFDRDSKSYDLNIKRKNNMISNLEFQIYSVFKKKLFEKVLSPKDKRQGIYILKNKITLANKKS